METLVTEKPDVSQSDMMANAHAAAGFLKVLANEHRLLLLCLLAEGERSVSSLEEQLGLRQPAVSQQLARLRAEGMVDTRRDGKAIYYSLSSEEARRVVQLLYELFCATDVAATTKRP